MQSKAILTAILLIFVLASVVVLGLDIFRQGDATDLATDDKAVAQDSQSPSGDASSQPAVPESSRKLVAYYFHGSARCPSCMKIEEFTEEAIHGKFSDLIEDGRLEYSVVNVEESGNEHFVDDYQLYTKSVVLVDTRGGEEFRWKNLEKVWELLNDKDAFFEYIYDEVDSYLGEG